MNEFIMPAEKELTNEEIAYLKEHGVVELVRCKDCEHGEKCWPPHDEDYWWNAYEFYQTGNWFCADGRKKDEIIRAIET